MPRARRGQAVGGVVVQADDDVNQSMETTSNNSMEQHHDLDNTRHAISGRSWPTPVYGGKISKTNMNRLIISTTNTRKQQYHPVSKILETMDYNMCLENIAKGESPKVVLGHTCDLPENLMYVITHMGSTHCQTGFSRRMDSNQFD